MSGHWPPEWEDPDEGHSDAGLPDERQLDAGHAELDLSEVAAFLASVPSPDLPPSFEARISAAIAAEAAARATIAQAGATKPAGPPIAVAGADDEKSTVRSENQKEFSPIGAAGDSPTSTKRRLRRISKAPRGAAGSTGPGHSRPDGRRRRLRMPSGEASAWLVVCCLVIAGFGYLFAHASGSSSSSSAASSAAAPAAGTSGKSAHEQQQNTSLEPEPAASASASAPIGFTFIESGTSYQRSTLAGLVRRMTNAVAFSTASGTSGTAVTPASSAPASAAASATTAPSAAGSSGVGTSYQPSPALTGCVFRLTGEVTPSLVDRASYDGIPAYIIAVQSHVWVVGLGCTATDPHLITQVPLKG